MFVLFCSALFLLDNQRCDHPKSNYIPDMPVLCALPFEHMLQRIDPILADLHAELGNLALPITNERGQTFAEHGVVPFADECVIVPMLQRARYRLMCLQLDVKPVALYAESCLSQNRTFIRSGIFLQRE